MIMHCMGVAGDIDLRDRLVVCGTRQEPVPLGSCRVPLVYSLYHHAGERVQLTGDVIEHRKEYCDPHQGRSEGADGELHHPGKVLGGAYGVPAPSKELGRHYPDHKVEHYQRHHSAEEIEHLQPAIAWPVPSFVAYEVRIHKIGNRAADGTDYGDHDYEGPEGSLLGRNFEKEQATYEREEVEAAADESICERNHEERHGYLRHDLQPPVLLRSRG